MKILSHTKPQLNCLLRYTNIRRFKDALFLARQYQLRVKNGMHIFNRELHEITLLTLSSQIFNQNRMTPGYIEFNIFF